jgi:hypothetical protein
VTAVIYPCPFAALVDVRCDWSDLVFEMGRHVENSHSDDYIRVTERSEWIHISVPSYQKAIFTLDKLFFLLFSLRENCVRGAVFHVGHKNDSVGYIYDFKIGNSEKNIAISGVTCYNYREGTMALQNLKCVYIQPETLKFLPDDNTMSCAFQIKEGIQPMECTDNPKCQRVGSNFEYDIPLQ